MFLCLEALASTALQSVRALFVIYPGLLSDCIHLQSIIALFFLFCISVLLPALSLFYFLFCTSVLLAGVHFCSTSCSASLFCFLFCMANIQDEVEEAVGYARRYWVTSTERHRKVWYKLYTSPDTSKWLNIHLLCELAYSLPFSTSHVEQMFHWWRWSRQSAGQASTPAHCMTTWRSTLEALLFLPSMLMQLWTSGGRITAPHAEWTKIQGSSTNLEQDMMTLQKTLMA